MNTKLFNRLRGVFRRYRNSERDIIIRNRTLKYFFRGYDCSLGDGDGLIRGNTSMSQFCPFQKIRWYVVGTGYIWCSYEILYIACYGVRLADKWLFERIPAHGARWKARLDGIVRRCGLKHSGRLKEIRAYWARQYWLD